MLIIETVAAMKEFVREARKAGQTIALVPTMGALHRGHAALMARARPQADIVVASIFVNPTQFGPNEDFAKYPRNLTADAATAEAAGVDVIFHPTPDEMYPHGFSTYVDVETITDCLCGSSRPGHFRGVATVVTKLFNIVQPHTAFFGQKDAQQVLVLKRMAEDLNMNLAIEIVPTVREADGLALSSRNAYLSPAERQAALVVPRTLAAVQAAVAAGERSIVRLTDIARQTIASEPLASLDYAEIYQYPTLTAIEQLADKALLAVAVKIGTTRLIDNAILEV